MFCYTYIAHASGRHKQTSRDRCTLSGPHSTGHILTPLTFWASVLRVLWISACRVLAWNVVNRRHGTTPGRRAVRCISPWLFDSFMITVLSIRASNPRKDRSWFDNSASLANSAMMSTLTVGLHCRRKERWDGEGEDWPLALIMPKLRKWSG